MVACGPVQLNQEVVSIHLPGKQALLLDLQTLLLIIYSALLYEGREERHLREDEYFLR